MATSESDDFESADEELNARGASSRNVPAQRIRNIVDSESDDDTEFIPTQTRGSSQNTNCTTRKNTASNYNISNLVTDNESKVSNYQNNSFKKKSEELKVELKKKEKTGFKSDSESGINETKSESSKGKTITEIHSDDTKNIINEDVSRKIQRQRVPKQVHSFGARRLGTASSSSCIVKEHLSVKDSSEPLFTKQDTKSEVDEIPDELKSNLKFKDIFKPDEWEAFDKDVELPDILTEEEIEPVSKKIPSVSESPQNSTSSWSGWDSWGVSSLLNTATASVSTLTSRVSQGIALLEETIGAPDPADLAQAESNHQEHSKSTAESVEVLRENQSQTTFGFGNFMSGVSSITKLVESTGSKVITGGLDTLETIGKKTMEVLQEGDPGLKKKRAFFKNEMDKPILSQMLREAKEKAEADERTVGERQAAKKVCFESLFDDYQGLVHLEALEMLSKQSNMKIQHKMINLDARELTSIQETLDEIKELCDLGDDEEEELENKENLEDRLKYACKDIGVNVTYDKLNDIFQEIKSVIPSSTSPTQKSLSHQELLEQAISALAQFTAYSVERFHKTAELLLIKERRSTVSEADALVQLTRILSGQISIIASLFCDKLNEMKNSEMHDVNSNITSIFLEAANASSYVQDAFRLLIPIIQVGAI